MTATYKDKRVTLDMNLGFDVMDVRTRQDNVILIKKLQLQKITKNLQDEFILTYFYIIFSLITNII